MLYSHLCIQQQTPLTWAFTLNNVQTQLHICHVTADLSSTPNSRLNLVNIIRSVLPTSLGDCGIVPLPMQTLPLSALPSCFVPSSTCPSEKDFAASRENEHTTNMHVGCRAIMPRRQVPEQTSVPWVQKRQDAHPLNSPRDSATELFCWFTLSQRCLGERGGYQFYHIF